MNSPPRRGGATETAWASQPPAHRWRWVAVDAVASIVLLVLVAAAFLPTYRTWWVVMTVVGSGVVGLGLGLLGAMRRWKAGRVALAAGAAWFVLGTPLVMPSAGVGGILPTGRSLVGLLTGPVTAWRDMLTLEPPIGETANLLAVPALVALAGGLLAAVVSLRSHRPALAFVPLAVAWLAAITLGSLVTLAPAVTGAVFFVVVLLWTSHRRASVSAALVQRNPSTLRLRWALAGVSIMVAGAVAMTVGPLLAPTVPRATARAGVEPPIEIEQFTSPLQGFRANVTRDASTVLLGVAGNGDEVIRIATLDQYDGISFNVATTSDTTVAEPTFNRVGEWIADDTDGDEGTLHVTVEGYEGVWVPTSGRTTRIRFEGDRAAALSERFFYNRSSGTGIALFGLQGGDAYSLSTITTPRPPNAEIALAAAGTQPMPRDVGVPESLRSMAREFAGTATVPGAQALALEKRFQNGWFSHGQPGEVRSTSGHSASRLVALLADPERMVGDGEQYAVAMTLMARELGIPARVVYGYRAPGSSAITGADVGAWSELQLGGLGWVLFNPTPPTERVLDEDEAPRPQTPQPHIENPPPPAQEPDNPPPDDEIPIDPGEPPVEPDAIDWAAIGVWMALGGIPLLTIVVPLVLVLGLKLRRRSRRRHHHDVASRVAGAWAEVVDRSRDLGRPPSPAATRSEQAEQLVAHFARIRPRADPLALSREVDWVVFAPEAPTAEAADQYWGGARDVERGIRRSVSRPRWWFSRLSTKSLRKLR